MFEYIIFVSGEEDTAIKREPNNLFDEIDSPNTKFKPNYYDYEGEILNIDIIKKPVSIKINKWSTQSPNFDSIKSKIDHGYTVQKIFEDDMSVAESSVIFKPLFRFRSQVGQRRKVYKTNY